jgi:hypothetical protein
VLAVNSRAGQMPCCSCSRAVRVHGRDQRFRHPRQGGPSVAIIDRLPRDAGVGEDRRGYRGLRHTDVLLAEDHAAVQVGVVDTVGIGVGDDGLACELRARPQRVEHRAADRSYAGEAEVEDQIAEVRADLMQLIVAEGVVPGGEGTAP